MGCGSHHRHNRYHRHFNHLFDLLEHKLVREENCRDAYDEERYIYQEKVESNGQELTNDESLKTLKMRFAKGEINEQEYLRMKSVILGG